MLRDAGVTKERIEQVYEELRGDDRVTSAEDKTQFEALEQYGRNICDLARAGKLDPVIGRTDEIRRTIQVLSRRTKNNPCLLYTSSPRPRPLSPTPRRRSRALTSRPSRPPASPCSPWPTSWLRLSTPTLSSRPTVPLVPSLPTMT